MNTKLNSLVSKIPRPTRRLGTIVTVILLAIFTTTVVGADIPSRAPVRGTVPNPGTQQQELGNITFPAPYNVFEFPVTCMACHGGTIDQQTSHGGNWAGTAMASAARDPVFRANQIIVNNQIKALTGKDGAGNMCFRCHSPNGWLSGRFDPTLNGAADGSTMIHTILLSTDDEGIMCETCHRTMGAVEFKRADLDPMDAVWNMMASIDDWPHSGNPYVDQDGDPTIAEGNPYGDTTLQFADGMTYGGRYPGYVQPYWSDTPLSGSFTGQTYGVYPPGWIDPFGNDVSGQPVVNADGSIPIQFDIPIGPPLNPNGTPCYNCQSVSLEHPTFGASFVEQPEFCGSCHELTVPVLNHGMPEQRTYTEWKYSAFGQEGPDYRTCQSCHMPRLSHEYGDASPVTLNADPVVSGWFPYAKSRTNTAMHKFAGANRDLPMMMKELYPEVDFEVIGGAEGAGGVWVGTGNDPRIFPGMLSTRDTMWDRNQRNTEISLQDGVDLQIVSGPTYNSATGNWDVQVKVINNTGHRLPSGYPDGRRMWINLVVKDNTGALIYESGYYDNAKAALFTDRTKTNKPATRSLDTTINSADNEVMIYERVTGTCEDINGDGNLDRCNPSLSLLNDFILFDNRLPPFGFTYSDYRTAGVKFWNYDPATFVPFEEYNPVTDQSTRYANGRNFDVITYSFAAPSTAVLSVEANILYQSHTREFMEHLRANDTSTVRPEGPPRVWSPNYPFDPNYLSNEFGLAELIQQMKADGWLKSNETLRDNWGGISYAAWYVTGKGAPYSMAVASTTATLPPAPTGLQILSVTNPDTGFNEPYTQQIAWDSIVGADGYLLWIKYGVGETTASWDKLAVVQAPDTSLINTSINVSKTYCYKVQAYNGAGYSPESPVVCQQTSWDLPLPPENLQFLSSAADSITMTWYDASDNETGWVVFRQDAPPTAPGTFVEVGRFPSDTVFGGVLWTDTGVVGGQCYNYVIEAFNASGSSGWNINGPVQMCTAGVPGAPGNLTAAVNTATWVDLTWTAGTGTVTGYRVERSADGGATWPTAFDVPDPLALGFTDTTSQAGATYWYRVFAYNSAGDSLSSNTAGPILIPGAPPAAPSNLQAPLALSNRVDLAWTDNSNNENGFVVQRSDDQGATWNQLGQTAANITSFSDITVQSKLTYMYRVYAFNGDGISATSNEITVVTPGEIPQAPSNLKISGVTKTTMTLTWRDNAQNETGYTLEVSTDNFQTWTVISLPANTSTYTVTGLTGNTTYWFRVQAYNLDGVSAYSETVSAKTKKK